MTQNEPSEFTETAARASWRRGLIVVAVAGIVAIAVVVIASVSRGRGSDDAQSLAARRAAVERRGAAVMPFDQNATMHHFSKTSAGGVETVTASSPHDSNQIALVQEHLAHERELFAAGNFSDPMAIHGMKMPGVEVLQRGAAAGRITIAYQVLPNGARLAYTATDSALVDALHTWFDAQLMDHGSHATK